LIEKQGLKPMKRVIESLGGWPLIEGKNWQENVWYWQKILLKLELLGFNSNQVFAVSIDIDMKNSSKRLLYVSLELLKALI
jgi:neprilysin